MKSKKSVSMKAVVVLMALVLLIGCGVGGTLAWLMDQTKTVTNTFTVGDINIDLKETVSGTSQSAAENAVANNNFKILPGTEQSKNPQITVKAGSEASWVFVEITETDNYIKKDGSYTNKRYITWAIADEWTLVDPTSEPASGAQTVTYVYGRKHDAVGNADGTPIDILKDNKVSYSGDLTKEQLDALDTAKPALKFKAYAVQQANGNGTFDIKQAWDIAQDGKLTTTNP